MKSDWCKLRQKALDKNEIVFCCSFDAQRHRRLESIRVALYIYGRAANRSQPCFLKGTRPTSAFDGFYHVCFTFDANL